MHPKTTRQIKPSRLAQLTLLALFSSAIQAAPITAPLFLSVDKAVDPALVLSDAGEGRYQVTANLKKGSYQIQIADQAHTCGSTFGPDASEPLAFGKVAALNACAKDQQFQLEIFMPGDYKFTLDNSDPQTPTLQVARSIKAVKVVRQPPEVECASWQGGPVTVSVGKTWPNGTELRDAYSGETATVKAGKITLTPAADSEGILLLEPVKPAQAAPAFSWNNATVYFMLTDRFNNGDPSNDNSFGRKKDGKNEVGTWHGGDFKGITERLDYIKSLGANAIWITPMVEQVHGFIGGGEKGSFPFYGYHGYWPLDFTRIDPNYGDEAALQTMVDEAHKRGLRVLLDVVMNHAGNATLADLQDLGLQSLVSDQDKLPPRWSDWKPATPTASWHDFNQHIDYQSPQWKNWWGPNWVRSDLPGFQAPGGDEMTRSQQGLLDFITESTQTTDLPPFLKNKRDTGAVNLAHASVSDYLVKWNTDWVRKFGFDGFRADTVKHVEPNVWAKLKGAATRALKDWKAEHPDKKVDDLPFYMIGEVWFHGVDKDLWFDNGFDSLINFDYQRDALKNGQCMKTAEPVYAKYARLISKDPNFNVLSYISSHDTKLFFGDYENIDLQRRVANSFMLLPGGVQIYYGDESGRSPAFDDGVLDAAARSDMNWKELNTPEKAALLGHWQKLGAFRTAHPAIAGGSHQKISDAPYAFVRQKGQDKVMIVFAGRKP